MDKNEPKRTPVQLVKIESDYAGQRVDNFLITRLKGMPKTRIYRLLRKGEIRVNKKRTEQSYRLQDGDEIRLPPMVLDEKAIPKGPSRRAMSLLETRILFEDKGLLIINKPSGMPVHGGTGVNGGVVEALRAMYPALAQLELVHRLDLATSGCLILAKKRSVLRELHGLLREGKVHKIYWALTKGQWKPSEYYVDAPLRKNQLNGGERMVRIDETGKPSLTEFEPLQSYNDAMLVQATLHTGRTHQIRVHARFKHHPVAGDEKYGDKEFNKKMREFGLRRMFLHSHSLEFTLPSSGQHVSVTAPLDADLQTCLDNIK